MGRVLLSSILAASFLAGCAPSSPKSFGESLDTTAQKVPDKVEKALMYIDEHHEPPPGYEGGREFHNAEGLLPKRDDRGRPITYREWDVNPKVAGVNRGPERLVTGSDGSAYYTSDHYRTFIQIR
jgi:ribonuclease T1